MGIYIYISSSVKLASSKPVFTTISRRVGSHVRQSPFKFSGTMSMSFIFVLLKNIFLITTVRLGIILDVGETAVIECITRFWQEKKTLPPNPPGFGGI